MSLFCIIGNLPCRSQLFQKKTKATPQDALRGAITAERAWWEVIKYDITVTPDYNRKMITGTNIITCKAIAAGKTMQIDLQQPMQIRSVSVNNQELTFKRKGNAFFIHFRQSVQPNDYLSLTIRFDGNPREAANPPWNGGWVWKKDKKGNPWISAACQGLGASVWYPCRDHQGDEPDSASLTIIVPDTLVAVGNGRLRKKERLVNGMTAYTWAVVNPINGYNIIPYIGKYVSWSENFEGEKGNLDLTYWVLEEDLGKAKEQFRQTRNMLGCFEHWFGPYPFYEDGYQLVQAPYLGMEHQSAVAYGNGFMNGYLGRDMSHSGWGKKWDFVIIHESAHEWFGNNITSKDIADMWVHEGFATYAEALYVTCFYGVEAGNEYSRGLDANIENNRPVIGPYGVNKEGSMDMYSKGACLVHIIRQLIGDDEKFRSLLRGLNSHFYHQTVASEQIEKYISHQTGRDLSLIFDQYLRTTKPPVWEYKVTNGALAYRWSHCVKGFNMPLKIRAGKDIWLLPTEKWQNIPVETGTIEADRNFYIQVKKIN